MILVNRGVIGLEVDSREMRAVELKASGKGYAVSTWGRTRLTEGVVIDGRVANTRLFSESLHKLITENGFKSKDIVLGVNNQDVIMRFASFPKVPADKVRGMIQFQAQDHIPVPINELELDYVVVGEKSTEEGDFINVVLVGARKKMLNDFIIAIQDAGVNVKEIDSAMLAIGRAALISSSDGTFALVGYNNDIGNVLVFSRGVLGMARTVNIVQSPAWIAYIEEGTKSAEKETSIISDILLTEVRSSVNYFRMQNGEVINKLYVLGCNSKQNFVSLKLGEATGLSVTIPNPYTDLEKHIFSKNPHSFKASDYTACVSLAIRGLEENANV